jgi:hypothetical protein
VTVGGRAYPGGVGLNTDNLEQTLLNLVERLNHPLTVVRAHDARRQWEEMTGVLAELSQVDGRLHTVLQPLHAYAGLKVQRAIGNAVETRQAGQGTRRRRT